MQEEELLNSSGHATETIGWVVLTNGIYNIDNILLESVTVNNVNNNFKNINFNNTFNSSPNLLTKLISYNGSDTANTRVNNLNNTSFNIQIDEEQSKDNETSHIPETIGYMVFL